MTLYREIRLKTGVRKNIKQPSTRKHHLSHPTSRRFARPIAPTGVSPAQPAPPYLFVHAWDRTAIRLRPKQQTIRAV